MEDTCEKLVQDFADWSRKYPDDNNDLKCLEEFEKLEDRAKLLKPKQL